MNLGLWFQTAIYWQDLPNAKELNADLLNILRNGIKKIKDYKKQIEVVGIVQLICKLKKNINL